MHTQKVYAKTSLSLSVYDVFVCKSIVYLCMNKIKKSWKKLRFIVGMLYKMKSVKKTEKNTIILHEIQEK